MPKQSWAALSPMLQGVSVRPVHDSDVVHCANPFACALNLRLLYQEALKNVYDASTGHLEFQDGMHFPKLTGKVKHKLLLGKIRYHGYS